jgi:hypothetical protein
VLSTIKGMPASRAIFPHRRDVDHVDRGIAERLREDRLRVGPERAAEILRIVGIDQRRLDPQLLKLTASIVYVPP